MTTTTVTITASSGSAGQALGIAPRTDEATLRVPPNGAPVEYKVGAGAWTLITDAGATNLAIDLSADTLRVRKADGGGAALLEVDAVDGDTAEGNFVATASQTVTPLNSRNVQSGFVTLDGNVVFVFPTPSAGVYSKYSLTIKQDAIGGWMPIFPANVVWAGGVNPSPPLVAGDFATFDFYCVDGGAWNGARISNPEAPLALDRFARANSAVSLGTSEIGGAWTAHSGTWGTTGLSAYCAVRAGDSVATVSTGSADHTVYADVTPNHVSAQPGLVGRVVDANNYWLALPSGPGAAATLTLFKRVGGSYTDAGSVSMPAGSFVVGQATRLELAFSGNAIAVRCNGILRISITDADLNTAVRAGLRTNDANAQTWNNFSAVAS